MSSQQEQPQQPTVRHIPIFVEGRSEPLVNTLPESQPSAQPSHHSAGRDTPNMDMPHRDDFFKPGSIFDGARNIPVRTFPNSSFMGKPTGFKREASPAGASRTSPFSDMTGHMWSADTDPLKTHAPRGSSVPRQTPSPPTAPNQSQQQPKQPQPANAFQQQNPPRAAQSQPQPQQQQQQPQPNQQQQATGQDQPDCRPKMPSKEDPITKIQKIQKDVLAIFDQVEQFKGGKDGKKDKAYVYLDEMLTQNLLKLDSIDAEDQPQIKSARKEAIKSINTCIAVLEAKAEAGASGSASASSSSIGRSSNGFDANGTNPSVAAGKSASNTSIPHSSSNSSQPQPNEELKQ